MCRWYEAHLDAHDDAWEKTPEGRQMLKRWEAEEARMTAEEDRARGEARARERQWRREYPREWAEWERVRPLWAMEPIDMRNPDDKPYDFGDFLAEVEPAPPRDPGARVERKDESLPFRRGNVHWVPAPTRPPKAGATEKDYLTLQEVADLTGFSYDFVRDQVIAHQLPGHSVGRRWRVRRSAVPAWVEGVTPAPLPTRPELRSKVRQYLPGLGR